MTDLFVEGDGLDDERGLVFLYTLRHGPVSSSVG
jgi:hypothetical protein